MVWYGDLIMAEFKDDAVVERVRASRRRIVKRCGGGDKHRMFRRAKRVEAAHKTRVIGFETSGGSRGE